MAKVCLCGCGYPVFSNKYAKYCQNKRTDDKWLSKQGKSGIKKRINPISDKKAEELKVYREVRDKYMSEHEVCEYGNCTALANDLHHKAGRGIELSNSKNFMAVCRNHHTYIHLHPKESRSLGYLI